MILEVATEEEGLTVAEFLQRHIPSAPQGYLRQLLKKGKIRRDAQPVEPADRLAAGDTLRLPDSARLQQLRAMPAPLSGPLTVLYESREILIVDKPAGLAVHSSQGHEADNLTARVEALLARRGEQFSVAPIHRLDLETSGPILFGKGKQACAELGKMFMRHEVEKHYLALVVGKAPGGGKLCSEIPSKGKLKEAVTEFRALSRNDRASLLELRLGTGRQHQIRRQLAQLGQPIFGDLRYGGPCPQDLPRMFLHSCRLAFVDPFSGAQLDVESPLPEDLKAYCATLFDA
jgi:RluA family pseudouridine synthase